MDSETKSNGLDNLKTKVRNPDYLHWVHLLADRVPLFSLKNHRQNMVKEEWILEKVNP